MVIPITMLTIIIMIIILYYNNSRYCYCNTHPSFRLAKGDPGCAPGEGVTSAADCLWAPWACSVQQYNSPGTIP